MPPSRMSLTASISRQSTGNRGRHHVFLRQSQALPPHCHAYDRKVPTRSDVRKKRWLRAPQPTKSPLNQAVRGIFVARFPAEKRQGVNLWKADENKFLHAGERSEGAAEVVRGSTQNSHRPCCVALVLGHQHGFYPRPSSAWGKYWYSQVSVKVWPPRRRKQRKSSGCPPSNFTSNTARQMSVSTIRTT